MPCFSNSDIADVIANYIVEKSGMDCTMSRKRRVITVDYQKFWVVTISVTIDEGLVVTYRQHPDNKDGRALLEVIEDFNKARTEALKQLLPVEETVVRLSQ